MTQEQALQLVGQLLQAKTRDELQKLIGDNVSKLDHTFFAVINEQAKQLEAEGKPEQAKQLTQLGATMLKMRFLI